MKKYIALTSIFISCASVMYGQSNSDEIQRLQKLVKENEERAIRAEAAVKIAEEDAKRNRYILTAFVLTEVSIEMRDKELSALLAVQAYNLNRQFEGYAFNNKIYNALFNSLKRYERAPVINSSTNNTKSNSIFSARLPNSQQLVMAEENGNLKFVTEGGAITRILSGHSAQVDQITFSRSGQLMATSGKDNTIRIWNLNQLNQRPLIIIKNTNIGNLTFSQDDSNILFTLTDLPGKIQQQPLDVKKMVDELCGLLTRNLTKEEWGIYIGNDLAYEQTCSQYPANNK